MTTEHHPNQSSQYAIRIKGLIDPYWDWLLDFTVIHLEPDETLLSGPVVDQAALHGILARIRDLNLTLLSIEQIASDNS
jgi:hypothetical protein